MIKDDHVKEQCVPDEFAALSKLLQVTMTAPGAFMRAVEQGYIKVRENGTLEWMLENSTLLAYFCGRIWCGDRGEYSRRKKTMLWEFGGKGFPATALGRIFGVPLLKQRRLRRKNMVLPRNHELVDYLFDSQ